MASDCFLGLDLGTVSVRAGLYRPATGSLVALATAPYSYQERRPGRWEIDFDHVWRQAEAAMAAVLARHPEARIRQLGVAATASTVAWADREMRPLGAGVRWSDQSAADEAVEIERTGHPVLRRMLGHVSPEWGLPKFLRLVRNGVPAGAASAVELLDWVNHRLTGELVANTGIREWGWSLRGDGAWPLDLYEALGLTSPYLTLLPERQAMMGTPIAPVRRNLERRLPQLTDAEVVMGGMDSFCAAAGLGVAAEGRLCLSFGSSSSFLAGTGLGDASRSMYGPMHWAIPGPGGGFWQAGQSGAGLAVGWVRGLLRLTLPTLEDMAAGVPPGSQGLLFRETLLGRRNPDPNSTLRGRWDGLSLDHGPGHLYRSVLEGIAMGARYACRDLKARELVATGGLTRSRLFLGILADVFGIPVGLLRSRQTATLGAAFAAESLEAPRLNPVRVVIEPGGADYGEAFARYVASHLPAGRGSALSRPGLVAADAANMVALPAGS